MKGTRGGLGHGGPHSRTGQTQTRRRGGRRDEEKEAKTVAAQSAGSSSHAARRRTRTHAHIRTHKHAQLLLSGRGHAQNCGVVHAAFTPYGNKGVFGDLAL